MHEYLARPFYYLEVHFYYASLVWCAAWILTLIVRGSATAKYWVWVATLLNFSLPVGAVLDKSLARYLLWARPLGVIGDAGSSHRCERNAGRHNMVVGRNVVGGALVFAHTRRATGYASRAKHGSVSAQL